MMDDGANRNLALMYFTPSLTLSTKDETILVHLFAFQLKK